MSRDLERHLRQIGGRTWRVFLDDALTYIFAFAIVSVLGVLTLGVLSAPLSVGFIRLVQRRVAGETVVPTEVLQGTQLLLPALMISVIIAIGVALGTLALVIPGLLVVFFTTFALHFMAYDDLGISDSLSASFDLVRRQPVAVLLVLSAIGFINVLGSGVALVGLLLTGPLSLVALTMAFEELRSA